MQLESWMRSSGAGRVYLLLAAAGLLLYALARRILRSDAESRIGRTMEWAALTAIGAAFLLAVAAEPFNA